MTQRIDELVERLPDRYRSKAREVPMPTSGFLIHDYEYEKVPEDKQRFLTPEEVKLYMSSVGNFIWIQGIRLDILFAVLYLSWFTKKPRYHHLEMAYYCIEYLYNTRLLPLVVGGADGLDPTAYSDASLGTGPKGRSVTSQIVKLYSKSGAVFAKTQASAVVRLSSFEAELDACTNAMKSLSRLRNMLVELGLSTNLPY